VLFRSPRNIRLAEAPSFGKPIVVYDVASVGAQSYMNVARELMTRNGLTPRIAAPTGLVANTESSQPPADHDVVPTESAAP